MSPKEEPMPALFALGLALLLIGAMALASSDRPRAREIGLVVGVLPPGPLNAITDVAGVKVGQVTLVEG
jgi:D-aminopeptidase